MRGFLLQLRNILLEYKLSIKGVIKMKEKYARIIAAVILIVMGIIIAVVGAGAPQVAHLMNHLTRRQRQAITLYYLEERKYDEIWNILHMNYHSVRNLMHRGMLKLREAAL